ncbi:Protein of unknown function [Trujillonella endophytica]|uniref:DUF3027 domain-containing protein n=1 Tax=Trujillonella endophytica TaxID=673521 RepID=A0A1H8V3K6_9ACTN|nr:Protein of unknown function [Trujillella endophytica]
MRDNGAVPDTPSSPLAAAVDLARAAAEETAGDPGVIGEHLGVGSDQTLDPVLGEASTHSFASSLPGYVGWFWAVTIARAAGEETVTVDEVVLLPGDQALLAPAWVPWHERLRPGDLSVGDVLPNTEDDPRLVPAYTTDDDAADDLEARAVAQEIGLGRERVLSREGRSGALTRWNEGEFGPRSPMARHAPGHCGTCGFFLPLAGSLRGAAGACGNAYAPADGRVVTVDYGCGAHSQASLVVQEATEVVHSARYDTSDFDLI